MCTRNSSFFSIPSSLCLLTKLILSGVLRPSFQILGSQVIVEEYQRRQPNQWEGSQKKERPKGIVARNGRFLFCRGLARDPISWVFHSERTLRLLGRSSDGRTTRWRQRMLRHISYSQLDSLGPCVGAGPSARFVPSHRRHAACRSGDPCERVTASREICHQHAVLQTAWADRRILACRIFSTHMTQ